MRLIGKKTLVSSPLRFCSMKINPIKENLIWHSQKINKCYFNHIIALTRSFMGPEIRSEATCVYKSHPDQRCIHVLSVEIDPTRTRLLS